MTQLEQTIIATARQVKEAVVAYYRKRSEGQTNDEDYNDYLVHYHAMNALLVLGHQAESGISREAAATLREIEDEEAAGFRANP
ncbi:hypothetical protein D9M70_482280 [compost metagenome]